MSKINIPKFFGVEEGKNSAVRLGEYVVADGMDRKKESSVRIQSHTHSDHLSNWKHHIKPDKKFVLSEASKEILMLEEKHIKRRANIHTPTNGSELKINLNDAYIKVKLLDAKHMIGSVQCTVEYSNGDLFGYSGDIGEDVDQIIKADYLVLDTAYTNFQQGANRTWTRNDAFKKLLEVIEERTTMGPIHIYARTGMLQEAAQYIERFSELNFTYVGSNKIIDLCDLFKKRGQTLPSEIEDISTFEKNELSNLIYLRPYESKGNETLDSTVIDISNFSAPNETPEKIISKTDKNLNVQICISNHVHGDLLKNYIEATEAKFIITDSSRSTLEKSVKLSKEIKNHLNIDSMASHEIDYWKNSEDTLYD